MSEAVQPEVLPIRSSEDVVLVRQHVQLFIAHAAAEEKLVPAVDLRKVHIRGEDDGAVRAFIVGIRVDHAKPGARKIRKASLVKRVRQTQLVGVIDRIVAG